MSHKLSNSDGASPAQLCVSAGAGNSSHAACALLVVHVAFGVVGVVAVVGVIVIVVVVVSV